MTAYNTVIDILGDGNIKARGLNFFYVQRQSGLVSLWPARAANWIGNLRYFFIVFLSWLAGFLVGDSPELQIQ